MINSVVLVGRLASDPEMRYTPSGMPVARFRLAVDRGRRDEEGADQTDFFTVVAFQRQAELVSQYLDKGALVGVEGRLQSRSWESADGRRQTAVEIIANTVRFLESRAEAERRRAMRGTAPAEAPSPASAAKAAPLAAEAELPPPDYDFEGNEDPFADL